MVSALGKDHCYLHQSGTIQQALSRSKHASKAACSIEIVCVCVCVILFHFDPLKTYVLIIKVSDMNTLVDSL